MENHHAFNGKSINPMEFDLLRSPFGSDRHRQERVTLMTGAKTTVTLGPAVKDLKKVPRRRKSSWGPGHD